MLLRAGVLFWLVQGATTRGLAETFPEGLSDVVTRQVLRSLGRRRGQGDVKPEPVTDSWDARTHLPVTREDFQRQIKQLNHAVQQWKSGAAAVQQVIKTQGEKHQQFLQGSEPEFAEERSDSFARGSESRSEPRSA
jgi:hypothetical protein